MGKRIFTKKKMPKLSTEHEGKIFDGAVKARLGSEKNPACVTVPTAEREAEVAAVFEEHGWAYAVSVDPDTPEDTADLERLLHPPRPVVAEKKAGRNDPCPCGSGKKYKKCCGA